MRVRDCLRERLKDSDAKLNTSALSVTELKKAELNLIRYVQRLSFSDSYNRLIGSCC